MRDVFMETIHTKYPTFVPRHDFDILALSDGRYKGPEEDIRAWLDRELASSAKAFGGARQAIEGARNMLSGPVFVTGAKPAPGDAGVFVRQIPDSQYYIRLFPGNPALREYCLDFVETSTGQPVNSPMKFQLWLVGNHNSPYPYGSVPLRSLESAFGVSLKDILPGEEKFVLTDGMTCVLTRPGHKPVRFTVPTRIDAVEPFDGVDLDFPQQIQIDQ
ncbi:hypothetical protein C8T65DRAFT_739816 [Cerioporus squamosus]|nr:hypothetical protein C8T65DRAFT_739816 [Cerioporus squamosus]